MEFDLHVAKVNVQILKNKLRAAKSTYDTSYFERVKTDSKLQTGLQQLELLRTELRAA